MAQAVARKRLSNRRLEEIVGFSNAPANFTDIGLEFLEEQEEPTPSSCDTDDYNEDDEDESSCDVEENKKFWGTQNQLLQVSFHFSSLII